MIKVRKKGCGDMLHIVAYSWVKLGMIKGETFSQLKMHCHLGFVFHRFNYALSK